MTSRRRLFAVIPVALLALAGAASSVFAPAAAAGPPTACDLPTAFDPANFPGSARVDHTYLPLVPGTQRILQGGADRGDGFLAHQVTFTVTSLTKVINGVNTVVVLDTDVNNGVLVEQEIAFFAQDNAGNVWYLGEYPEEFLNGSFVGAPSTWIAGQDGAEPGVQMLADPQVGAVYSQGNAPSVDFLDCGVVIERGNQLCNSGGCFNDVLLVHENSPLEPGGGTQTKTHAPGIGVVDVGAIDDPEAETLALRSFTQLDATALELADQLALQLDQRAYEQSAAYASTEPIQGGTALPPAEPPPGAVEPPVGGDSPGGSPIPVRPLPDAALIEMPPLPKPTEVRVVTGTVRVQPSAGGQLSFTGSSTIPIALAATALLVIGFALVVLARRPRRLAFATVAEPTEPTVVREPTGLGALCTDAIRSLDELIQLRDARS